MSLNPSGSPKPTPVPPGQVQSPDGPSSSRSTNAGAQECMIPSLKGDRPSLAPAPSHAVVCSGKLEPVCTFKGVVLWSCPRCGAQEVRKAIQ